MSHKKKNPQPIIKSCGFYLVRKQQKRHAFTMKEPIIIWFDRDLRLRDNPALYEACRQNRPILPLYIHNISEKNHRPLGAAANWWLHHSLKALNKSLSGNLCLYKGSAEKILPALVKQTGISTIYWNENYEPTARQQRDVLRNRLEEEGISVKVFHDSLLYSPDKTAKDNGEPYQVFTPFYRRGCLEKNGPPAEPLPSPKNIKFSSGPDNTCTLEELDLLPRHRWIEKLEKYWEIGEKAAQARLEEFLEHGLQNYKSGRDEPGLEFGTSRLSPHLHFGEISARDVWHAVTAKGAQSKAEESADTFCSELGWRDFNYTLLLNHQDMHKEPLREKYKDFPWRKTKIYQSDLKKWQKGRTGFPLVDAGMRQLWETGWMHNRVRMVVASFLIKDLLIPWQEGERWFWDCLVDADPASNPGNWQWVAGCGADAAPFFRIFNPTTQGEKFDPDGVYIRRFVPELKNVPDKYVHAPHTMPTDLQEKCDCIIGKDYPAPMIDHKDARKRALEAYEEIK